MRLSESHGTDGGIVSAWIANSRHRRDWAAHVLRDTVLSAHDDPLIAVWGLAYKENTHSVKNSPSLATLGQFPACRFKVHDPAVPADAAGHARAERAGSALDAAAQADALMILTPWPEYGTVTPLEIADALAGTTVIDPYRVLDGQACTAAGLTYHTLGMAPLDAEK